MKVQSPTKSTWQGGSNLATSETTTDTFRNEMLVTRAEYAEFGAGWVARRFHHLGRTE